MPNFNAFREEAIASGYSEQAVDLFIGRKKREEGKVAEDISTKVGAVEAGFPLERLSAKDQVAVYNQLRQRGVDLGAEPGVGLPTDIFETEKERKAREEVGSEAEKFKKLGGNISKLSPEAFEVLDAEGFDFSEVPTTGEKPEAAATRRLEGIISTGLSSLDTLQSILDPLPDKPGLEGLGKLRASILPFIGRDIKSETENLTDVIGRLRSGAAINAAEEKRFRKLLPLSIDSESLVKRKLKRLREELETVSGRELPEPEEREVGLAPTPPPAIPQEAAGLPPTPQELRPAEQAIKKISEFAPPALAIAGGIVGGIAMGIPGSVAATILGTRTGILIGEGLETAFGIQDETREEIQKKAIAQPLMAGALDLATAGLFKAGGAVLKGLGVGLREAGERIALKAIRPSKSQINKFAQLTGRDLTEFTVEKGLFKKGVEQVDELIGPIQKSFDDIALSSNRPVLLNNIVTKIDDVISVFKDTIVPKNIKVAKQLEKSKSLLTKKFSKAAITVADITKERRIVDKAIKEVGFAGKGSISDISNKAIRDILQGTVRESTEDMVGIGGRTLGELGGELNKLYSFRKIADAQKNLGKGNLPFGLLKTIWASVGAGVGAARGKDLETTIKGALFGLGLSAIGNNPKVISFVAKSLIKSGDLIKHLPASKRNKLMTDVFRRILTNIGAVNIDLFGREEESTPQELPSQPRLTP